MIRGSLFAFSVFLTVTVSTWLDVTSNSSVWIVDVFEQTGKVYKVDIRNKRVMILGGWGLVGSSICRKLLLNQPAKLVICSLTQDESQNAVDQLKLEHPDTATDIVAESGNLFVRWDLRYSSRDELLNDSRNRKLLLDDVLKPLNDEILQTSFIYTALDKHRPDILVDAVNSATALAYQDIYSSSLQVLNAFDEYEEDRDLVHLRDIVEKNLCTSYVPQLIRHVQVLYNSMVKMGTAQYIKIGTSGTGGMGLNIPYTHSEERPSRVLLSKSSLAGAHSLLLFLMARTPGGPIIKEFKPTAAISWKSIEYGTIKKGGKPFRLFDMPPSNAVELGKTFDHVPTGELEDYFRGQEEEFLKDVYIDSGENGTFSMAEFTALTSIGQMEYITPEEIADSVIYEIRGGNTGHDVINAFDEACMGPTYRAGAMRQAALDKLESLSEEHGTPSVAFEMLGPPRLSKLLYEAHLIKRVAGTVDKARSMSPEELSLEATKVIESDSDLRKRILSIGIPILLSDGRRMLRGPKIKVPTLGCKHGLELDESKKDLWADDGWVDLRISNFIKWQERFSTINDELEKIPYNDTSSRYSYNRDYWQKGKLLNEGRIVAWVFRVEEKGARMKS